MVQLDVATVRTFTSELKNPNKIIRGCAKFHVMEPRDIVYLVARKIISENPNSEYNMLAGVEVLLLTWNAVYLQRQPEKVRERLEDDILEAYKKTKPERDSLEKERLETVDLMDRDTIKSVKEIFKVFSGYRSIESTGASKAIHLIMPDLFMMWDNEISRNYHRLHPLYRIRYESSEECYAEFMKTMSDVAKAIMKQKSISEMQQMYNEQIYSKEPQLRNVFSEAAIESLPKMLDECNFMRFKKDEDF